MPAEAVASSLASDFPESLTGRSVLLPRALVAPEDLPEALAAAGARVTVFPVYRTVQAEDSAARIQQILREGEVDIITFTSSSTVQNFLLAVPVSQVPPEVKIACIGPVTARTATEAGLNVTAVADEHTIPGLVAAIQQMGW
jgi:uroporphyrinogen III methyltransferase/synthase